MDKSFKAVNIGMGQRNWRYIVAGVSLIAAIGLGVALVALQAPRLWRLAVYLPLAFATGAFFEAQDRTCVVLANRGECSLDDRFYANKMVRGEKVQDESMLTQLRRQARRVTVKSQLIALIATAAFLVLPI